MSAALTTGTVSADGVSIVVAVTGASDLDVSGADATIHREGTDAGATSLTKDSNSQFTILSDTVLRKGEHVTLSTEGVQDGEASVDDVDGLVLSNGSERLPVIRGSTVRLDDSLLSFGTRNGHVKVYRPDDPELTPYAGATILRGEWLPPIQLDTGITYRTVFRDRDNDQVFVNSVEL